MTPEFTERSRQGWLAVAILFVLNAIGYLDRQIMSLLIDPISLDLGATDFQMSILSGAAFVVFYVAFALPVGWAVDRFPRRHVIFMGVLVWSVCTSIGGMAGSYWQLLVSRFGVGAGEAALGPGAYSILSDLFPRDRLARAVAVFSTGAVIGGALSYALGGFIISATSGADVYRLPLIGATRPWQMVFLACGFVGLLALPLLLLIREPQRKGRLAQPSSAASGPSIAATFGFMRRHWRFYACHFAAFGLMNLMLAGNIVWMPSYIIRTFHWSVPEVGGTLFALTLIFFTIGMLLSGSLVDAWFRRGTKDAHLRYYAGLIWVVGVAGVIGTTSADILVVLIAIGFLYILSPFMAVAATALQITTPNEFRGQISAIFLLVYNIFGYGLGPSFIAAISDFALGGRDQIGNAMAITFLTVTPLAFLALALGLAPMRRALADAEQWD